MRPPSDSVDFLGVCDPYIPMTPETTGRVPSPTDELGERSHDLRGRLLRQEKQGHRRSIGRYRVLMQAATIRRGRRRRWLLLSDNLGRELHGKLVTALAVEPSCDAGNDECAVGHSSRRSARWTAE